MQWILGLKRKEKKRKGKKRKKLAVLILSSNDYIV